MPPATMRDVFEIPAYPKPRASTASEILRDAEAALEDGAFMLFGENANVANVMPSQALVVEEMRKPFLRTKRH